MESKNPREEQREMSALATLARNVFTERSYNNIKLYDYCQDHRILRTRDFLVKLGDYLLRRNPFHAVMVYREVFDSEEQREKLDDTGGLYGFSSPEAVIEANHLIGRKLTDKHFATLGKMYRSRIITYEDSGKLMQAIWAIHSFRLAGIAADQEIIDLMSHQQDPSRGTNNLVKYYVEKVLPNKQDRDFLRQRGYNQLSLRIE